MDKKKLNVIIGHGRCGKSSLIRALTGIYRSGEIDIAINDDVTLNNLSANNLRINTTAVLTQSAQEGGISPIGLVDRINRFTNCTHALVALRRNGHGNERTLAIDYLNELSNHFIIENIVVMSRELNIEPFEFESSYLNLSLTRPINANASIVRHWWRWL